MSELETVALAEQEMAWLAIRQPAIVRMLERDLGGCDTDALAAGLELTSQLLGELSSLTGEMIDRVSSRELAIARARVASTELDPEIVIWTTTRLANLPVVLSAQEQAAIGRAIATVTMSQTIGEVVAPTT